MNDCKQVAAALAAPFDPSEVKFKPAVVSGNRALALPYVDARVIQDRLDEVLGVCGWQDEYDVLPDGSVVCKLRCKIDGEWVTKTDVGGPSEQPDEGDRRKAAFSDALKRAAVKWGVGRYLYRLSSQWVDYDQQKRQFVRPPTLPASAIPKPSAAPSNIPAPAKPAPASSPISGADGFAARLRKFDERMASTGLCRAGECIRYVLDGAAKAALPSDMLTWNESHQAVALGLARAFEADHKKGAKQP
jgi:hypothetical protein